MSQSERIQKLREVGGSVERVVEDRGGVQVVRVERIRLVTIRPGFGRRLRFDVPRVEVEFRIATAEGVLGGLRSSLLRNARRTAEQVRKHLAAGLPARGF